MQLRYGFRLHPSAGQRAALARASGCARVVYNDALRARETARSEGLPFPKTGTRPRTAQRSRNPPDTAAFNGTVGGNLPPSGGRGRQIGSSSYSGSQFVEAQWASRYRRLERFVTEQPPYSILVRGTEEDVLPTVRRHGMGTLTYSPLAGGWLSGRYRKDNISGPASAARPAARFDMTSHANQRKLDAVEQLAVLAEKAGLTLIELAVAFVLNHPGVTAAIIGPRTMEQLEAFLPAADVTLPADVLDRIDEIVAPGVTVNPADNSYGDFELRADQRRR
ncbi:aldo/keto reductase [Streptomyces sp. NPDC005706]|uniref:aldo/keto reductase n=1 Tax=Streptomyces sp. NPDC005706 TaxID=3157169 RepID=UPI0033F63289